MNGNFSERSGSVAVSISMTNLLDTGLPVLVFDISPDFRTWEDHLSTLFHSEKFDELASITGLPVPVCCTFDELRGTFWLSDLVFPEFSDAVEVSKHGRVPCAASRHQIRHWLWFCCDSFFTCIFLRSFRHRFDAVDGAAMAKDGSTQHVWNSPLSVCLRVGFRCQCIWFGSWGPNWFYQTTHQAQLCGFWKHVSL